MFLDAHVKVKEKREKRQINVNVNALPKSFHIT